MARTKLEIPAAKPDRSQRATTAGARSRKAANTEPTPERKPARPRPAKSAAKVEVRPKAANIKLERGRFTMPATEFAQIAALKVRAVGLGRTAKKNELLRIGLSLVSMLADEALAIALDRLQPMKTAKPKKPKPAKRADSKVPGKL